MERVRGKRWCGNINLGEEEDDVLPHWDGLPEGVKYMVWQREVGVEGREHLQMYVETEKQIAINSLRDIFPGGYWQRANGSAEENKTYCQKAPDRVDGPWELGASAKSGPVVGGKRKAAFEALRIDGYEKVVHEKPDLVCAVGNFAKDYCRVIAKVRREERGYVAPKILVIFGDPDVGKTALAYEMFPSLYRLSCKEKDIWWDGYNGEKCILLDDFYGQIKYSDMLQLLDGYPNRVQVKGSFTHLNNDVWIITSNVGPWEWWKKMEGSRGSLYSRLWDRFDSCVVEFRGEPWNGMVIHDKPQ